jgi:CHAT domain-containing protein
VLLDKLLFEKKQAAQSPDNEAIKEEIFALKKQGELLREEIKAVCPDYFMKHPPLPKTDLKALQNSLSANEAVLEFFTADSTITTFLLRRDTLIHSQITAKKEVEIQIKTFREAISAYFLSDTKSPDLYLRTAHEYVEAAYWLYQKMIMPIETYLPENMTIIPDGILAYLPFEALLSTKPQRPDRFHTHDYWNKKHSLRYTYSTALLREMSESPANSAPQSLLALAPFYDGSTQWHDSLTRPLSDRNRTEFTPLPFSGEEVYKVAKLMDGKALTGKIATKAAFQREAGQYRTLHLATHARANDGAGDYSYINFAPTPEYPQGERLYVSEIYGLRLNADLVTLSACETGLGKMYRGEGVVSIARAFASAGARCILQSQWTVSDAKTRHLMIYFYQNLKNGLAKDVALHLAKEEYLRKFKGEEAHPYFWAGFVLVGR